LVVNNTSVIPSESIVIKSYKSTQNNIKNIINS